MERGRFQVQGEVQSAGIGVVRVSGELDYDGVAALEDAVRSVRALGSHCLLLDLSGLTFMDSSGVNALLKARRDAHVTGGWMRIATLSRRCSRSSNSSVSTSHPAVQQRQ